MRGPIGSFASRDWKRTIEFALIWGVVVLGVGVLVYRSIKQGLCSVDDAYITYRYAAHLADGYGFVWNIGGEPVEGYTSPLHVVLLAVGLKIGLPLPFAALLINAFSIVGLVYIFLTFLKNASGGIPLIGALILAVFLFDTRLAIHMTAGLDTVLFMFLLAACFVISVRFVESPTVFSAIALAVINVLSLWGRPDAAPFILGQALVIGGFAIYAFIIRKNGFLRYVALSYGVLLAIGASYMLWKQLYFGYLLPNPFYVKSNQFGLDGLPYVIDFINEATRYGLIIIAALVFLDSSRFLTWLTAPGVRLKVTLMIVPPTLFLLYYLTVVHEVAYANRFEYPVYFFLTLALALPFSMAVPRFKFSNSKIASVALASGLAAFMVLTYRVTNLYFPYCPIMDLQYYRPIGEALQRTGLGNRATIVLQAAGEIPFLSEFSHVDPVGLTDNVLSGRTPINAWERERYIWATHPDVYIGPEPPASFGATDCPSDALSQTRYMREILGIYQRDLGLLNSLGKLSPTERCEVIHLRMRELRDRWTFLGQITYPLPITPRYRTFGYVRTDSPYFQVLVNALEPIIAHKPDEVDLNLVQIPGASELQ